VLRAGDTAVLIGPQVRLPDAAALFVPPAHVAATREEGA
jgi:hypothetical protein